MEGKIYMNQENKIINTFLKKIEDDDFLVFELELDNVLTISLNTDAGQTDIRNVFSALLSQLIEQPLTLRYIESPEYASSLYSDVSKEYIDALNRELKQVRKRIPETLTTNE